MLSSTQEDIILQNIRLHQAVETLDRRSQAVVALISIGFTQMQIARLLGISRTSVGNTYRKARRALREFVTQEDGDAPMPG